MSPSQSFPLLQLPLLAQLEVLKNMDHMEFLTFSVLSERSKAIAAEMKYPLKTCRWTFYDVSDICLEPDSGKKGVYLTFLKYNFQLERLTRNKKSAIIKLNGQDIRIFLDRQRWIIDYSYKSGRESLKLMDTFTEHIFTVFRFKEYELHAYPWIDIVECFVWKHTRTFEKVLFINDENHLTDSGIQFVMEQLKVTELAVKSIQIGPEFEYTGPLTMYFLRVPTIDWISRESIRNMKCSLVWVDSLVDAEQLNTMLKDWQQGGLANLESLRTPVRQGDDGKVLEGIETFKWEERPRYWRERENYFRDPECKEIRRVDGTVATVQITCDYFVKVCVWHPKYLHP